MAERMRLSRDALTALETWLPGDLTEDQLDNVIIAAESMAVVVYQEAADATRTITRMRTTARNTGKS